MIRWAGFFWLVAFWAVAAPPAEVQKSLGAVSLSGSADIRFFGFHLYKADLWQSGKGFALTLSYKRAFSAEELSTASIKEIARMEKSELSKFSGLEPELRGCLADVSPGDRITGVSLDSENAKFYFNGQPRCAISYPEFRDRFFGIWLGPNTRDPKSRDRLLGREK